MQINLDDFEKQAENVLKSGSSELNSWLDDLNYTLVCKNILESPNVQINSTIFCILVLKRHVESFFHIWDPDVRIQFCEWLFTLSNPLEQFLNENPYLLRQYSALTSLTVSSGFDNDPRFQELFKIRTTTNPTSIINNKICLCIFNETPQYMKKLLVRSFSNQPNAGIIHYAINSIRISPPNPEIIEIALNVIKSCIEFYIKENESKPDDFQNEIIDLDQDSKNILITPQFIEELFTFSQNGLALISFEILRLLLASPKDFNLKTQLFECYILNINIITQMPMNPVELNSYYRLVLRLQSDIIKFKLYHAQLLQNPNISDQNLYFQALKQITIKSNEFLSQSQGMENDKSIIENIFSFYTLVNENSFSPDPLYMSIRGEYVKMKLEILSNFVENTLAHLNSDDEINIDSLGLNKSQSFPEVFESLNTFTKNFAPEALQVLFSKVPEGAEFNSAQLAFISNVTLSIMKNPIDVKEQDIEVFSQAFSEAILKTISLYQANIEQEYVIDSFLLFVRHFKEFTFLCKFSPFTQAVYGIMKAQVDIGSIPEMLESILGLLSQILNGCDNVNHVIDACRALSYLFEKNSFTNEIPSIPFVQNLVSLRVESPFPFLTKMNHSRSRTQFHYSIANILVRNDSANLREKYLSIYDTALTEPTPINAPESGSLPESLWGFLCDFTGFFHFAQQPEHFQIFCSYLFYQKHFEVLDEIIPQVISFQPEIDSAKDGELKVSTSSPSYLIMTQLLKFWTALLRDNRRKIQFGHHSNLGLRLFKFAVNALKNIVAIVKPIMKPGDDITRKTISYVFKIMNLLFQASFGVPFYSFDYFKDPILIELLSLFNDCLGASPPDELVQYPKLGVILVQLTRTICEKQLEVAARPELNLMETILSIINATMRSMDKSVRDNAIKSFEAFTKFEGVFIPKPESEDINDPLMMVISEETILNTTFKLLDIFFVKGNECNVLLCIKEIFRRLPKLLDSVHAKMSEYLLKTQEANDNFERAFQEFYSKCDEMYSSGNTAQFEAEIKKFKDETITCLSAPTKVFV